MIDGCSCAWRNVVRTRSLATLHALLAARGPGAGGVGRPDALPDHDPGGVEALEQALVERVLAARRVGVDRLELRDDAVLVDRAQAVAAAEDVLVDRGAAQLDRRAVEQQVGALGARRRAARRGRGTSPRRGPRARAPTGSASRGDHSAGIVDLDRRLEHLRALLGDRLGREARASILRSPRVSVPRTPSWRGSPLLCTCTRRSTSAAPPTSLVCIIGCRQLALADPADADAAVDAAEVEPQPVPAVALHRGRPAPVGAHDERVARAGLQERADVEGQVLALVARRPPCRRRRPRARWLTDSKRSA